MALPGMYEPMAPAPEWRGAHSAKFTDPITGNLLQRKPVPSDAKLGTVDSLARNGFHRYFTDTDGLVPMRSKKEVEHVENSQVYQWKSGKRTVAEPGADHVVRPEGIKVVDEPPRRIHSIREKRHIRQVESKEETYDLPQGLSIVHRDNGIRAKDQPAREVDVSMEMNRKARPLDLWSQRNGIPARAQGDKAYRHPEYHTGFYMAGNLVVGSGFMRGPQACVYPKQLGPGHSGLVLQVGEPMETYQEKEQKRSLRRAQDEVKDLTADWEKTVLKECGENYAEPDDSDDE